MKKLLACILCLSMMLGAAALAAETELNRDVLEGTTHVSLTVDPDANSFVVVIPASVTIDEETQEGSFDVTLKSGWKLVSSNGLRVRIKEFANSSNSSSFVLKNSDGSTGSYSLSAKAAGSSSWMSLCRSSGSLASGWANYTTYDLIDVEKGDSTESDQTATLKLRVPTLPTAPGEYTDTITFGITLY